MNILFDVVMITLVLTAIGGAIYAIMIINNNEKIRQEQTITYMKKEHNLDVVFDEDGNMHLIKWTKDEVSHG